MAQCDDYDDCGNDADHEFYEAETGTYSYACDPCLKASRDRRLEREADENVRWAERMEQVLPELFRDEPVRGEG